MSCSFPRWNYQINISRISDKIVRDELNLICLIQGDCKFLFYLSTVMTVFTLSFFLSVGWFWRTSCQSQWSSSCYQLLRKESDIAPSNADCFKDPGPTPELWVNYFMCDSSDFFYYWFYLGTLIRESRPLIFLCFFRVLLFAFGEYEPTN
jgi:hypothetical protein